MRMGSVRAALIVGLALIAVAIVSDAVALATSRGGDELGKPHDSVGTTAATFTPARAAK